MIKLIIFDLDGTLVDSQPLQYRAYNTAHTEQGYPITEREWKEEWVQNAMISSRWAKERNLSLDPKAVSKRAQVVYRSLIDPDLALKPGAEYALETLSKKYPLVIASSSHPEALKKVTRKFGFNKYLKRIISDTEVPDGKRKPAPDVFLYAAEVMGVQPAECVVIEDTIGGLTAASMKCIICPDAEWGAKPEDFVDADRIIKSLEEISVEMIEQL